MFIAYHKETTKALIRPRRFGYRSHAIYETKGGCTRAINASAREGRINAADYAVLPIEEFKKIKKIEKVEVVKNLMTGKSVAQSVNIPHCLDVSSEAFWTQ